MKAKIIVIIISISLFSSCSDFLDEENKTQYSSEYIYSTPGGLKLAVNALYTLQRNYYSDTESATCMALIRATDETVTNGGTGNFYGIYDPNYLKPSAAQVLNMWRTMYNIIGKANDIIAASLTMEDSPYLRKTVAEARCFRAQSYFQLYRTYDRIWLNTIPTTPENVDEPKVYKPASQQEVFDLLYEDLDYAIINLDWKSEDEGRFNQAAARHIKAKAAMWIKDWDTALEQVNEIDLSGAYHLVDLENVFNSGNLTHDEVILAWQWSKNPGGNLSTGTPLGHYLAALFIGLYRTEIGGTAEHACSFENWGYTYGRCLPSPYLFSLYDQAKDKRYQAYYVHQYKNTTNQAIKWGSITVNPGNYFPLFRDGAIVRNVYPGCVKYGDIWTREPFETRGYKDVMVYRLAETYVMGAEAALMKNNQTLAKYYYNKTWERAGNNTFTGNLTIENIIDEQARELAFEGDRWYFLKRLGILIKQVSMYAGDPRITASIAGRTNLPANPHFIRWPIPESEVISMGEENFPQNVGYN
ncbi:membrane protein [Bacteroidia bacterium]|nr:membrane protein [Bacteroidia bacterium]GHV20046.1 membrane protein [Bacteroidia bacterium]